MAILNPTLIAVSIGITALASIALFASIFVIRCTKKRRSHMKKRMGRHISYLLIQVLTSDEKTNSIKRLKRIIGKKENMHVSVRALATQEFINLARTVSNDHLPALQGLFLNLGLQHFNIQRAEKGRLKQKLKAFEVLSKLRIITALPVIKQYVLDPNKTLRAEAIMSLMRLSYNPLFFLDNQKVTLSVWEAMKIHGMLKEMPDEKIPQFSQWLNHRQKTVVLFCLRMILHYQQKADLQLLTRLSKSKSVRVAEEAQKALILRKILVYSDPDEEDNQIDQNDYQHLNVA
ncbi:hypothetical protein [Ekhidna sp.]|jgi:hypothetical protein|uniref:hypothetical protein n=1 Tax=Ekhidna sp. TaxID=2608089 RepID=UPI0032EEF3F5